MIRPTLVAALSLAATTAAMGAATTAAAQDPRATFDAHCASCHALTRSAAPGPGPNLAGLLGSAVGADPRFDYSPALRAARTAGDTWDVARLDRFLEDPEEMYPGLWMGGNVPRRAADRAAILRHLEAAE